MCVLQADSLSTSGPAVEHTCRTCTSCTQHVEQRKLEVLLQDPRRAIRSSPLALRKTWAAASWCCPGI